MLSFIVLPASRGVGGVQNIMVSLSVFSNSYSLINLQPPPSRNIFIASSLSSEWSTTRLLSTYLHCAPYNVLFQTTVACDNVSIVITYILRLFMFCNSTVVSSPLVHEASLHFVWKCVNEILDSIKSTTFRMLQFAADPPYTISLLHSCSIIMAVDYTRALSNRTLFINRLLHTHKGTRFTQAPKIQTYRSWGIQVPILWGFLHVPKYSECQYVTQTRDIKHMCIKQPMNTAIRTVVIVKNNDKRDANESHLLHINVQHEQPQ